MLIALGGNDESNHCATPGYTGLVMQTTPHADTAGSGASDATPDKIH